MSQKWNYRVIKSGQDTDTFFSIQEVYYGEGEEDKNYSHTLDCTPNGNSIDEVKTQLERMLKSLDKPILDEIPVEEADEELPDVVYYESTDGGRTLQVIDLDETEENSEEARKYYAGSNYFNEGLSWLPKRRFCVKVVKEEK